MSISLVSSTSIGAQAKTLPHTGTKSHPLNKLKSVFQHLLPGSAWAIKPERIRVLPWVAAATIAHYLTPKRFRKEPDPAVSLNYGEGLVGGLYGLATGGVFFTESQFFTKRDASKIGFAVLNQHLQKWGFAVNDGKNETPHLKQAGFENISRADFRKILDKHAAGLFKVGRWHISADLEVKNRVPAEADGLKREDLIPA